MPRCMIFATLLTLALTTSVKAQAPAGGDDLAARLAALEARLEQQNDVTLVDHSQPIHNAPVYYGETCNNNNCNGSYLTAGVDLYFLKPTWESNPAFYVGNAPTAAGSTSQIGQDFDWNLEFSPAFWVGGVDETGFGWRARYWMFDDSVTMGYAVPAGQSAAPSRPFEQTTGQFVPGQTISTIHNLEFHVIDAEVMHQSNHGHWAFETSAGLRILDIEQSYGVTGNGQSLRSTHDFQGIGPTLFGKVSRNLMGGPVDVFASGRQSLLFGTREAAVVDTRPGQNLRSTDSDGIVSISEIEIGLSSDVEAGMFVFKTQVSFVGQLWTGVGNASNGDLFSFQQDQDMGLVGGRATISIEF